MEEYKNLLLLTFLGIFAVFSIIHMRERQEEVRLIIEIEKEIHQPIVADKVDSQPIDVNELMSVEEYQMLQRLEGKTEIEKVIWIEGLAASLADWEIEGLVNIAYCESTFRPSAQNGQYKGLFQIGTNEFATYGSGDPFNEVDNTRAAINLYLTRGFQPWECQP